MRNSLKYDSNHPVSPSSSISRPRPPAAPVGRRANEIPPKPLPPGQHATEGDLVTCWLYRSLETTDVVADIMLDRAGHETKANNL